MSRPEPCLSVGRGGCHSPVACGGWGYCRERNFANGVPSKETQKRWQKIAAERARSALSRASPDKPRPDGPITEEIVR